MVARPHAKKQKKKAREAIERAAQESEEAAEAATDAYIGGGKKGKGKKVKPEKEDRIAPTREAWQQWSGHEPAKRPDEQSADPPRLSIHPIRT